MNIASRLPDSWKTVQINHISTICTIIKSLKRWSVIYSFETVDSRGVKEMKIFSILKSILKCLYTLE